MFTLGTAVRSDVNRYNHRHIPGRQEAALNVHGQAVNNQRQLYRFGVLILLAVLFIPLGYIVREISEENAMNILQIIAVFIVEAVRMFP